MPSQRNGTPTMDNLLCPDGHGEASTVAKVEELCRLLREDALSYDDFVQEVMATLGIHPGYYEEFLKMQEIEALWE